MSRAAVISDLHLRASREANHAVEAGLLELRPKLQPDDLLVVCGDVVNNGLTLEYGEALRLLKPFVGQLLLAPGNHECGRLGIQWLDSRWKMWLKLSDELKNPSTARCGKCLVAWFDSVPHTISPFDTAEGNLGDKERSRLRAFLWSALEKSLAPVPVFHHSVLDDNPFERLKDRDQLLKLVVDVCPWVFMGHEHAYRQEKRNKTTLLSVADFRSHPHPVWVDLENP